MINPVDETMKTLRAVPPVLIALVAGLDSGQARRRPAPDEWSVVEVVAHMRDVETHALTRVRRMVAEDDPYLPAFDQDQVAQDSAYRDLPLPETLHRYLHPREQHLHLLAELGPESWQRTGRHENHGPVTIAGYEVHVAAEEIDHLAQIARLVQPTSDG